MLFIFFISCKDDDDPAGSFSFGGNTYTLGKSFAQRKEVYDVSYWVLLVTSNGISYDAASEDFSGKGHGLEFGLLIENNDDPELPSGTYVNAYDEGLPYVDVGYVYLDLDGDSAADPVSEVDGTIQSAIITIEKNGDSYSMNFTVVFESGETLNGSYNGLVTPAVIK